MLHYYIKFYFSNKLYNEMGNECVEKGKSPQKAPQHNSRRKPQSAIHKWNFLNFSRYDLTWNNDLTGYLPYSIGHV